MKEAGFDREILTIRSHTGLSGDMLLSGFAILCLLREEIQPGSQAARDWLNAVLATVLPELAGCVTIERHSVNGIQGWQAQVALPHEHTHRHLQEIVELIEKSGMGAAAKEAACKCFELLAECEAEAHGLEKSEVHFHEVGALDSILDIGAACELYERLGAPQLVCSPLPVADGQIHCAHGILPAPAPAVMRLLTGIPVVPFSGSPDAGELVTPTAIALLRSLGAGFGAWPAFRLERSCLVYGTREFAGAANGVIFAQGCLI